MANSFDQFDVVDLPILDEDLKERINKSGAWIIGEDIVPSVYYRAFFVDGAWNADDESVYRVWLLKDVEESEGAASVVADEEPAEEPAEPAEGEGSEEPAEGGEEEDAAEAEALPEIAPKKWAAIKLGSKVALEITPSEALVEKFPDANVIIDGKEYAGLGILSEPIEFFMDRDHKVVIDWRHGKVYESFRIVVNR